MRSVLNLPIRIVWPRLVSVSTLLIVALLLAPSLVTRADNYETLDQSFEFKTGGTVKIESGSGEIKIEVWAEELVHVTAKKVEPAGHAVALSDIAFFNTKNQLTIKSQPADAATRIDIIVYVPRNTNLRITTISGAVQIRGAVSSAMVETKTGNIRLESPASQNADLVLTTTSGTIRSMLPIEPYGTPTTKALQGKLGSGGNPVILRSTDGSIQIAALEHELDQDVATIPSSPPPSSSSDSPSNYRGYGSNDDDRLFNGKDDASARPRANRNDQPYTYGGSYGGGSLSRSGGSGGRSGPGANTDVFGGGRDTNSKDSAADLNNGLGRSRIQGGDDIKGSFGVRIIPPPGSSNQPRDYDPDNQPDSRNDRSAPDQPPPLQPRKSGRSNSSTTNDDVNQNVQPGRGNRDRDQIASNDPNFSDNDDTPIAPRRSTVDRDQPVLRRGAQGSNAQNSRTQNNGPQPASNDKDDGTIKIDTKLVTLNVSAMDHNGRAITNLKGDNFQVYEDDVQQQISHFESVNSPFNLILLIDLSGSIIEKIDILRRAAIRFIEVTRPEDKVAVVSFTRTINVVSDFTNDRQLLRQRLQIMHMPKGGTAFYEALWFTTTQLLKEVEGERNAIVLMTDGVDNSISVTYPIPSRVTFEQVLRKVQESGALLFPIYLDTENENVEQEIESPESYVLARKQLSALAEASGGVFIRAERVEQLEGVYEKIAADLRTLYSIGYYPTNSSRDGTWRKIKVKLDKADVAVRTRRGYYSK